MDPYNTGPGYGSVMGQANMTNAQALSRKRMLLKQDETRLSKQLDGVRSAIAAVDDELAKLNGAVVSVTPVPATKKQVAQRKPRKRATKKAQA